MKGQRHDEFETEVAVFKVLLPGLDVPDDDSRFAADGMKQMPLKKQARGKTRLAWPMPADAMPSASTRGM